jgi:hypothetical protein
MNSSYDFQNDSLKEKDLRETRYDMREKYLQSYSPTKISKSSQIDGPQLLSSHGISSCAWKQGDGIMIIPGIHS